MSLKVIDGDGAAQTLQGQDYTSGGIAYKVGSFTFGTGIDNNFAGARQYSQQLTDAAYAIPTMSVIHARTAQGNFVDVKATPSGNLTTEESNSAAILTQLNDTYDALTVLGIKRDWTLNSADDAVRAVQSGNWSVSVNNHPTEYPLPAAQVLALTPQTNALTNAELRASAVPVSASSLPLPTGAATEATLSALNNKFNTLGQKTAANSVPVVIASDQGTIANPFAITWSIGGALASASNPAPVQLSLANTAVSTNNPIPTREVTDEATTYFTGAVVVPTTLTAATNYLTIRNPDAIKRIYIERIEAILFFTGTAAASRSTYWLRKSTTTTAVAGTLTTLTPEKGLTTAANSIAEVRLAAGGIALTGATAGQPFMALGHVNQLSANIAYDRDLDSAPIVLAQNEVLHLQAESAIVAGSTVVISFRWREF